MVKKITSFFILFAILLIGTGCKNEEELSHLEKTVREFDQYATVVDYRYGFETSDPTVLKVIVAYEGDSLYYIFQSKTPHRSNNQIDLYVNDERVQQLTHSENKYEDVYVLAANSLPDGETVTIDYGWRIGVKNYTKEIKLVKDIDDLEGLHVNFRDAKTYEEKDIRSILKHDEDINLTGRLGITAVVTLSTLLFLFAGYEIFYQYKIRPQTDLNQEPIPRNNKLLVYSSIGIIVVALIIFFVTTALHGIRNDDESEYVEGTVFEEKLHGFNEELAMNVTIPYTRESYQNLIFEKPVGGRLKYKYEITVFKNDEQISFSSLRMGSSGALVYKEVFEQVDYDVMEIEVYVDYEDELVLYRKYDLTHYKDLR